MSLPNKRTLNFDAIDMDITTGFLSRNRVTILYGIVLAILLFLLKWLEIRYTYSDQSVELYTGAVALIFTALGIWITTKLVRPKVQVETVVVEKPVLIEKHVYVNAAPTFVFDQKQCDKLGISSRELEVLQLMAEGLSNQEIAGRMFVSLNTVKTHASNLFLKLDVIRRTQAVDKGKKLNLIP
jgi:NarL family two-component system response regulator LiaR